VALMIFCHQYSVATQREISRIALPSKELNSSI
jgi:hypothetical protein